MNALTEFLKLRQGSSFSIQVILYWTNIQAFATSKGWKHCFVSKKETFLAFCDAGWQKWRKLWILTKILSPNICYLVATLRFVPNYIFFWKFLDKKIPFLVKNWASLAKICNYSLKQRICCENSNYALDESFYDHFCPHRKAANLCHPGVMFSFTFLV